MAEIAVSLVMDKLVPVLAQEAGLLTGLREDFLIIKHELDRIASFLIEAEDMRDSNDIMKIWVYRVRDLAYRLEDVVDEFTHYAAIRSQKEGLSRLFLCVVHSIERLKRRHEIASKIAAIKQAIQEINSRAGLYGIISHQSGGAARSATHHYSSSMESLFMDKDQLVGIEEPAAQLTSWLQEDRAVRSVISVVGMGGLGKTTLAKHVYDTQMENYDCHAWITVSRTYKSNELIKSIIRQFYRSSKDSAPARTETMEEIGQLSSELHSYARKMRYLVVFDDVWDAGILEDIQFALPENYERSRIIITTRNEDVARSRDSSLTRVFRLPTLSPDESWVLFCTKAFQPKRFCPPELGELSRAIVRKCGGLPLAIVSVGGVLSTKDKNINEWVEFWDSLLSNSLQIHEFTHLNRILSLSYHDLPMYLKPCLLYIGMFPQDRSIPVSKLIRLWIAEGFVKAKNHETLEDLAEAYLFELVQRNLIHVSEVDCFGKARKYRVHDLIHEVLLSISRKMGFCQALGENESSDLGGRNRRLSVLKNADNMLDGSVYNSALRSLLLFHARELPENFISTLFASLKLLKTLDLEDTPINFLPAEIGALFHLTYLSIRNTKVKSLPRSIGKLQQLETLDLKHSLIYELPAEIKRLRRLRHLLAYHYQDNVNFKLNTANGVKVMQGLGCSEGLQKLSLVEADPGSYLIQELSHFTQLRKLGITKVRREDGRNLCFAIERMKNLRSLVIISLDDHEVVDLQNIGSPPQLLRRLWLKGRMEMLPRWISMLQSLVRLHLNSSGLTDDPFEALQCLTNLLELGISNDGYMGEYLLVKKGWFQKLKVLRLRELNSLHELTIEKWALPQLEELYMGPFSPQLTDMPSGIQHLSSLQVLYFYDMPTEFCMSMVPEEGQNYFIIQHIPTVLMAFRCGPLQYNHHTLQSYGRIQARLI